MERLKNLSNVVFGLGFWLSAFAFFIQAYGIWGNKSAKDVSLIMVCIFTVLNLNSIFYGHYIAKNRLLKWGAVANFTGTASILILMWMYH